MGEGWLCVLGRTGPLTVSLGPTECQASFGVVDYPGTALFHGYLSFAALAKWGVCIDCSSNVALIPPPLDMTLPNNYTIPPALYIPFLWGAPSLVTRC